MSPRAAWRLEQLGFETYDYAGGKMDWLSFGLPYEGEADLVIKHLREVPSVRSDATVADARARFSEEPSGVVAVVNEHDVVLGALRPANLEPDGATPVSAVMREGPTTVRPSEEAGALAHRMEHAGTGVVLVTRSDGTLLGAFTTEADRDR